MHPLLLVLTAAALLLAACAPTAASVTPTPIPRAVAPIKQTYEVQRGEVVARIQFTGRVLPVEQYELAFPVDSRVRAV
jgi:multidrug efflux pump subunit AcrA (membrane-fusion protein)